MLCWLGDVALVFVFGVRFLAIILVGDCVLGLLLLCLQSVHV